MTKKKDGARPVATPWNDQEIATAARLWRELITEPASRGEKVLGRKDAACEAIADAIGRTVRAVKCRYRDFGVGFVTPPAATAGKTVDPLIDPEAERGRLVLLRARARQDAAAAWLNDPPPGFSALDQMRGQIRPSSQPASRA